MKTISLDSQQSLVQWVSQATGISTFGVKVRLRGNDLHILCEGSECPQRWRTLSDLLHALQQTDLDVLTSSEQPSIYQVFVYGRQKGEYRPQWCHRVYLNQLERHLEQVDQALAESEQAQQVGGALIVSNESLARKGDPNAIARYLSETLSPLGVAVQVKVKHNQPKDPSQVGVSRLWIFCQSGYNPDPSLLAEPIAQQLRNLKLTSYQDAVIASQVSGETLPDWLLRVDLTPPEIMLKEWARWGDVQAIARVLTEVFSELKVSVQASLQESTLHIFCTPAADTIENAPVPEKTLCLDRILPQLEAIAPQGILAATVYGQKSGDDQPVWIDWLSLPAAEHPALATSALELATTGDEPALKFLLERLLNPDLDTRLRTGGIRVLLLQKGDLLHIMCDAPVCPNRQQVAGKILQFMRQLKVADIAGVRVYGRRAGNKEPFWHYGEDLVQRQRLVPEPTPQFAATSEYVGDLVKIDTNIPVLRPDLTAEDIQNFVTEVARDWSTTATASVKSWLIGTQLFAERDQSTTANSENQRLKIALVWGALGLLLTLQTDWVLSQIVSKNQANDRQVTSSLQPGNNQAQKTALLSSSAAVKSLQRQGQVLNASEFTEDNTPINNLTAAPLKEKANAAAILLAARSQMPSFNVRQLDEQLALYRQRLAKNGHPPDVLIIGSSRALRGIDPAALAKNLAKPGQANLDIFNFGINGATAQVVNFVIRQVLEPSELPKLILFADGSRAFNSGREDLTFKAIAASPGYKQVLQKVNKTNSPDSAKDGQSKDKLEGNSYQVINDQFNQILSAVSASYKKRDNIKNLLQNQLTSLPLVNSQNQNSGSPTTTETLEENTSIQAVDVDGFLALSTRFNPTRYYQKHSKVTGNYDNDYKSFQVQGEQDVAFQEILKFAQAQKISLVFINMPLTADYLDSARVKHEQQFQKYMLNLATKSNFVYRDFSQLWLKVNDYFSDPSHLNRFGAYEVSKKLANDPMISWTAK